MSSNKNSTRKLSHGILKTRSYDDCGCAEQEHPHIRIFVRNPDNDEDAVSPSSENEFGKLKELYYEQCRSINESFLKKYGSQSNCKSFNTNEIKCNSVYPHSDDKERSHRESRNKEPGSRSHHQCSRCYRRH